MKKGEKRKSDKALKRRTAKKQVQRNVRAERQGSARRQVLQARDYPLEGCWARADWQEHGLAVIVVSRRQPDGNLVFGAYIVDYYCLGLKNTDYGADMLPGRFRHDTLPQLLEDPVAISPALAHEVIYGAIDYAAQFGFQPHADFKVSQYLLDPPGTHPPTGTVEFGYKGQPLYIQGPHDNVTAVMKQLTRAAGEGNFHYMLNVPGTAQDWDDDPD